MNGIIINDELHELVSLRNDHPCYNCSMKEICGKTDFLLCTVIAGTYENDERFVKRGKANQSPWISVNERLPEKDDNVFYTNCQSGALGVGYYVDNCWSQAYTGEDIYGITHWMQISKINE